MKLPDGGEHERNPAYWPEEPGKEFPVGQRTGWEGEQGTPEEERAGKVIL